MKYPRKIRLTVYLSNGDSIQGEAITITDEKDEEGWAKILRAPKELSYVALVQLNAFGDNDTLYINPTYITYIRVTDVQE